MYKLYTFYYFLNLMFTNLYSFKLKIITNRLINIHHSFDCNQKSYQTLLQYSKIQKYEFNLQLLFKTS